MDIKLFLKFFIQMAGATENFLHQFSVFSIIYGNNKEAERNTVPLLQSAL